MVDIRKVKILGKLLFKLETRGKTGTSTKAVFLMFSYLLPGCFLPFLLLKQNTDPTGFEFTFLTYLFYSLIICFTISSELDNLIVSQTETEIFNAMPIDDRLLVRAKLFMLNRYILILCLPLFIPGAVSYYYVLHSVPRAIMYFIAGYMVCYFIVNALLLLYSFCLRVFKAKRLSTYTLIFQLVLVLFMIIGYQLLSYGITGKQQTSAMSYLHLLQKKGFIDFFPQSWYAFLPARSEYELSIALPIKVILPLFICYMSYLSLRMYLEVNLGIIREKLIYQQSSYTSASGNAIRKSALSGKLIDSLYLRNNTERGSYSFMKSMFRQEKAVKLNIIPMIVIPIGLTIFAYMTNQLPSPFETAYMLIKPVFHISIMLSVLVVINTSILGMKVTNHPGASWIYEAYPADSRKHFKNGIRKFFIIYLLVPICILIGIILSFAMPFWQAALQALFIFAAANLYNSIFNLISRVLPFTKENTLINSVQKLSSMVFPFAYGTVIVMVQVLVYRSLPISIIALLIILTINFWLNFFGFVHIRSQKA